MASGLRQGERRLRGRNGADPRHLEAAQTLNLLPAQLPRLFLGRGPKAQRLPGPEHRSLDREELEGIQAEDGRSCQGSKPGQRTWQVTVKVCSVGGGEVPTPLRNM